MSLFSIIPAGADEPPKAGEPIVPVDRLAMSQANQSTTHRATIRKVVGDEEDEMIENMWPHFMSRTKDGCVDIGQLEQICEEVGIECDAEMLRRVIKAENQDAIYFQDAVEAVALALRSSKDDIYDDIGDEADLGKVIMSPVTYFFYHIGCGVYDPTKEYILDWSLCFTSKNLLVLSTMIVFTLVAAALIAFSSSTWMSGALEREQEMVENFQSALFLFAESLEKRLVDAHADSIMDTSNTMARWVEFMWRTKRDELPQKVLVEHDLDLALLEDVYDQLLSDALSIERRLAAATEALKFATSSISPLTVVVPLITAWLVEGAASWRLQLNSTAAVGTSSVVWSSLDHPALSAHCAFTVVDGVAGEFAQQTLLRRFSAQDAGTDGYALSTYFAKAQLKVCMVLRLDGLRRVALDRAVEFADRLANLPKHQIPTSTSLRFADLWVAEQRSDMRTFTVGTDGNIQDQTLHSAVRMQPLTRNAAEMVMRANLRPDGLNRGFHETLLSIFVNRTVVPQCGKSVILSDEPTVWCASYCAALGAVLTTVENEKIVLSDFTSQVKTTIESMNWEFSRTTEIVIGGRDVITDRLVPQATTFRFFQDCFGECGRTYESSATAREAVQTQSSGWKLAPDYRPQPVVSTFAYIGDEIQVPVVIERDVRDLRSAVLNSMVDIVNLVNQNSRDNQEVQLVRYTELPPMPFFDPLDACPDDVFCLERPGNHTGILYRDDCLDCERATALTSDAPIEFLTDLRYSGRCIGGCRTHPTRQGDSLARDAVDNQRVTKVRDDYTGRQVIASSQYLRKVSTALLVKVFEESVIEPIMLSITISAVIAAGLSVLGLSIVMWSTTRVLKRIEDEWHSNKKQLEAERVRFIRYTDFLVPRHVIRKVRSGHSMVAEQSMTANVLAVDVCGFSDISKGWPHGQVIRYATYLHYLIDETLALYGLYKLKSFGDSVVGVSGFGKNKQDQFVRNSDTDSSGSGSHSQNASMMGGSKYMTASGSSGMTDASLKLHNAQLSPIENCMDCGVVLVRLMSRTYTHIPTFRGKATGRGSNRHRAVEGICASVAPDTQVTKEAARNALSMPSIRVGIALGPLVSGYIHTGKTPRFDCYGPTMLVAMRMQLTAQPNRVHVSNTFREEYLAARAGKMELVVFDAPRKTIIKGRTTVVSYLVKEADINAPETFTARLGLLHSHERYVLVQQDANGKQISDSGTSSVLSRSTARSSRSSRSKKSNDSGGDPHK